MTMKLMRQNSTLLTAVVLVLFLAVHGHRLVSAHDANATHHEVVDADVDLDDADVDVDVDDDDEPQQGNVMKMKLIHKYSPHFKGHGLDENGKPKSQREIIQELVKHDAVRHHMMAQRRERRQQQQQKHQQQQHSDQDEEEDDGDHDEQHLNATVTGNSTRRMDLQKKKKRRTYGSIALALSSAFDYGFGQYLAKLKVGTPPQKFLLTADTGSDLTWMNCKYRCRNGCGGGGGGGGDKGNKQPRVFRADLSTTFRTIPCDSDMCEFDLSNMFSLSTCPTPSSPCRYDYSYKEGSNTLGFFANETIRANLVSKRKTRLTNVLVGCTDSIVGNGGIKGGDGILGLGLGRYSFTSKAAFAFGGKFSYCLVDHTSPASVSSYITFGGHKPSAANQNKMSYTTLIPGDVPEIGAGYGVNVVGLSFGGKMLNISSRVWGLKLGGGTVMDSGTALTYLAMPAYKAVMDVLTASLSKYRRLPDEETGNPFEFCFDPKGFNEASVPRLAFHFADGSKFQPGVSGYVVDIAPGIKCVGLAVVHGGPNVIGNIVQQNNFWEFDLMRNTVGWAASTCRA